MVMPMSLESNPPLVFFWIAEYNDNTALPQFDPDTCKENLFKDIDQSRLKAFGWYPFPKEFAEKLRSKGVNAVSKPLNFYRIELKEGWRLIAFRRNAIKYGLTGMGAISSQKNRVLWYALGFQTTVRFGKRERNVKAIMFIDSDGNVVMSHDHNWMGVK